MADTEWRLSQNELPQVSPDWWIVGVGDFTGDRRPDIVWQKQGEGRQVIWHMTGTTWGGGQNELIQVHPDWHVATPMPAPTGPRALRATALDAGGHHTCALTAEGDPYCWGSNATKQLGEGGYQTDIPGRVPGAPKLSSISGSGAALGHPIGHTCGVAPDGVVYCWGNDIQRQLGGPTPTQSCRSNNTYSYLCRSAAHPVTGIGAVASVSTGRLHTCAVTTQDEAYCWGGNQFGQLGTAATLSSDYICRVEGSSGQVVPCTGTPVPVAGGLAVRQVAAGERHSCALTAAGAAYCWGDNSTGALGNGTTTSSSVPVPVAGGHSFATISTSGSHTCGVTTTAQVLCWGSNGSGQLGNESTTHSTVPVKVSGSLTFHSVAAGVNHSCGISTDGAAYCWGEGDQGELGTGSAMRWHVPIAVAGGIQFSAISTGRDHTCGIRTGDGVAFCWGDGTLGAVGNGRMPSSQSSPVRVVAPS